MSTRNVTRDGCHSDKGLGLSFVAEYRELLVHTLVYMVDFGFASKEVQKEAGSKSVEYNWISDLST